MSNLLTDLQAVPLKHMLLRASGRSLTLDLPDSVSISRSALDTALVRGAISVGARFLGSTQACVAKPQNDQRLQHVLMRIAHHSEPSKPTREHEPQLLNARVVLAADGLNHACLHELDQFQGHVARGSRVGLGGVMAADSTQYPRGLLSMAVGRAGYVGLVRIEDDQLNVAAAVDPAALKSAVSCGHLLESLLSEAGFAVPAGMQEASWQGTPTLTRSLNRVAIPGVFAIGDAAGYVEPFTGEGMTWAMAGGMAVVTYVEQNLRGQAVAASRAWQTAWKRSVHRRQRWCRRLSWLLRHPSGIGLAVKFISRWPLLAQPVLRTMNDSRTGIPMRLR